MRSIVRSILIGAISVSTKPIMSREKKREKNKPKFKAHIWFSLSLTISLRLSLNYAHIWVVQSKD